MEYGLIGNPLGHSLSPRLHTRFGGYRYELCPILPEALGDFLTRRAFRGLNVTIPYKQAVLPYLDAVDPPAAQIGAVNTIVNQNGRLVGYNTDFGGLRALLRRAGLSLAGKKVLILGTGGTSKTAAALAAQDGAAEIVFVSRSKSAGTVDYSDAPLLHRDAQILIHTTPVGMAPDLDGLPLAPAVFPSLEALVDVVYNPLRTRLVQQAGGIPAVGGLYMLAAQAALSSALFTGREIPAEDVEAAYRDLLAEQTNLVLIGMPGSGKTTVGRLLAQKLDREFLDCDEILTAQTGKSPAALIRDAGEADFRALETALIRELSVRQGCVIATGGGAVTNPENVLRLKQNGRLYLLDRPLSALKSTPDRPLSADPETLRRLYAARRSLYPACADEIIRVENGDPADYADAILARMGAKCVRKEPR